MDICFVGAAGQHPAKQQKLLLFIDHANHLNWVQGISAELLQGYYPDTRPQNIERDAEVLITQSATGRVTIHAQ